MRRRRENGAKRWDLGDLWMVIMVDGSMFRLGVREGEALMF